MIHIHMEQIASSDRYLLPTAIKPNQQGLDFPLNHIGQLQKVNQDKVETLGENCQWVYPIGNLNVSPHFVAYILTSNPNRTVESLRKSPIPIGPCWCSITSVLKTSHPPLFFLLPLIRGTVPTADQTPPGPHPPQDPSLPPQEDLVIRKTGVLPPISPILTVE